MTGPATSRRSASPWEYDYAGAPWRTQDVVRRIATSLYGPTPDGEPGNDDLGAMSSWYVWAAMGLYPETPGRGELVLASPLFPHVTITLGDGRAIVIDAPGASPGTPYVQGLDVAGLTPTDAAGGAGPPARRGPRLPTGARGCRPRWGDRRPARLHPGRPPTPAWGSAVGGTPVLPGLDR